MITIDRVLVKEQLIENAFRHKGKAPVAYELTFVDLLATIFEGGHDAIYVASLFGKDAYEIIYPEFYAKTVTTKAPPVSIRPWYVELHGVDALGAAIAHADLNPQKTVWAVIDDEQLHRGSVLEAIHLARRMHLRNLVVVVNCDALSASTELDLRDIELAPPLLAFYSLMGNEFGKSKRGKLEMRYAPVVEAVSEKLHKRLIRLEKRRVRRLEEYKQQQLKNRKEESENENNG